MISTILAELVEAQKTLAAFISDTNNIAAVEQAANLMASSIEGGGKIISCGNGGSMCDAMHFAEELTGRYRDDRKALPAIAISDASHISCVTNDYGYDVVFSRYLEALGNKGDVLLAISTSGNSGNVLKAAETAKAKGMKVVGLTGKDGGKLAPLCDVEIRVPHKGYADRVQEVHIKVIHILIMLLEQQLCKE
ncbi:D-sedoheptulose 7-phosphate isomerase [Pontibacter harenae]|uniref:D-sedoheptulose 7-phosphate isomerase n=1 Tax=Pontibacter harenae TaxID=2894083 RepID=UPI001E637B87|nr:D-sedoheptulose 7-phosphate isomerase [Pontibacter harenae]MCC9168357.1 D-sedoheptulose 7-phosphate isomerase [Pontibacter harenae]